jgi:DnaJ-class molecular chaperone
MKDPYAVLGVARHATAEEIKRAFRRLAKRLHPDVNPGKRAVEQQFRELNNAYELLSDAVKRRRFDRGEIDAEGRERVASFSPGGARRERQATGDAFSIDELFQEFLHRGRRQGGRGSAKPAESAPQRLVLDFLEAARGGKRPVTLGDGRSVEVAVPPGIDTGQRLRLRDAQAGDAYLEVVVEPHPLFSRKDRDIHVEVPVGLAQAVLGGTITVPTIHGDVTVKVPRGSNSGSTLRLRGKGIVVAASEAGDQYVKLRVMLPDPPDAELTALVERWARVRGGV